MTILFNFNELKNIYKDALKSDDKTLIFDSKIGKGRFLFMMFFANDEDKDAKDMLFIHLRNIAYTIKLKMYGSHKQGVFNVYINETIQNKIIEELQLVHIGHQFDFINFLNQLNSSIPNNLPLIDKIEKLRSNKDIISPLNVIDEAKKTVLIGEHKLPNGQTPQDKTLRKLYMYTDGDVDDISTLIVHLKNSNRTVAWTTPDKKLKAMDIRKIINNLE